MSSLSTLLAPKGVLTVNNFITKGDNDDALSRVSICAEWFQPIVKSDEVAMALHFKRPVKHEAVLTPIEFGHKLDGVYYNVYDANGVDVFYRFDSKDAVLSNKTGLPIGNVFMMYTNDATRVHVPIGKETLAGTRYVRPTAIAPAVAPVAPVEATLDI